MLELIFALFSAIDLFLRGLDVSALIAGFFGHA